MKCAKPAVRAKEHASTRLPSEFSATKSAFTVQHLFPDSIHNASMSTHFDSRTDRSKIRTISTVSSRPVSASNRAGAAIGERSTEIFNCPSDGRLVIGSVTSQVIVAITCVPPRHTITEPNSRPNVTVTGRASFRFLPSNRYANAVSAVCKRPWVLTALAMTVSVTKCKLQVGTS